MFHSMLSIESFLDELDYMGTFNPEERRLRLYAALECLPSLKAKAQQRSILEKRIFFHLEQLKP